MATNESIEQFYEEFARSANSPPPKCGSYFTYVNPLTGQPKAGRYKCGKWRVCSICLDDKLEKEFHRLTNLLDEGHTIFFACTGKEHWRAKAKRLRRGSVAYKRYPAGDHYVVVAVEELSVYLSDSEIRETGTLKDVGDVFDFRDGMLKEALSGAPDKERISGQLKSAHQAQLDAEERAARVGNVAITVEAVGTDASKDVQKRAWAKAVRESRAPVRLSWHSDGIFAIEVKRAIEERTAAYKAALIEAGASIVFEQRWRVGVRLSLVDWINTKEYSDGRYAVAQQDVQQNVYRNQKFWAAVQTA